MDFQGVRSVLQRVVVLGGFRGEFAGLADRNESGVQAVGQRGGENKTARLHAQYKINALADVVLRQRVYERGQAALVFEERGDVVKEDPFFGEVRDFADQSCQ